jgi:ferredoxin--NADP+ reductase
MGGDLKSGRAGNEPGENGCVLNPQWPEKSAVLTLLHDRQPHIFTYDDWLRLNEIEEARGAEQGRPRLKFTRVEEMIEAVISKQ